MLKRKTFRGGYRFSNLQGQPDDTLEEFPIPLQANIPLRQGFGAEVDCLVKVGDKVSAGQIIGSNEQSVSSPIHATINGIVEKINKVSYFGSDCLVVSIKGDGSSEYQYVPGAASNWQKLSPEEIEKLLYLSGVTALDHEGIPTRFNSSIIQPGDVDNIILHGIDSEPYNISSRLLLKDKNVENLIEGIKILSKIMPNAKVHLALSRQDSKSLEDVSKQATGYDSMKVYSLVPKYPQSYDEMLVRTILKQEFPYGYSAANIGVIVLSLQAVLQVYEAVVKGKPLIERTIALCGPALKDSLHVKVRIGTTLKDVIGLRTKDGIIPRFILNGLLTGAELKDLNLPIDKSYSQIIAIPENSKRKFLAFISPGFASESYSRTFMARYLSVKKTFDTNKNGEGRPCISCNYCEEVCPVNIIPHILSKYVQRSIIDETLANLRIFDCIQCGLCSFVCPSKIPLAQHIKEGEELLTAQGCTRDQCILPHFDNMRGTIETYRGAKEA